MAESSMQVVQCQLTRAMVPGIAIYYHGLHKESSPQWKLMVVLDALNLMTISVLVQFETTACCKLM